MLLFKRILYYMYIVEFYSNVQCRGQACWSKQELPCNAMDRTLLLLFYPTVYYWLLTIWLSKNLSSTDFNIPIT